MHVCLFVSCCCYCFINRQHGFLLFICLHTFPRDNQPLLLLLFNILFSNGALSLTLLCNALVFVYISFHCCFSCLCYAVVILITPKVIVQLDSVVLLSLTRQRVFKKINEQVLLTFNSQYVYTVIPRFTSNFFVGTNCESNFILLILQSSMFMVFSFLQTIHPLTRCITQIVDQPCYRVRHLTFFSTSAYFVNGHT